jgi:DNA-binding winged helix-turn-helix (wHTH) protein/Tfp pilus assembly protein PilF
MSTALAMELAGWQFDTTSGELRRHGQTLRLEPKQADVLLYLAKYPGRIISKDELIAEVWAGTIVGEDSVWRSIYGLRKALEQENGPKLIETVPKRGYRLAVPMDSTAPSPAIEPFTLEVAIPKAPEGSLSPATFLQLLQKLTWAKRFSRKVALLTIAFVLGGDRGQVVDASSYTSDNSFELLPVDRQLERSAREYFDLAKNHYDGQIGHDVHSEEELKRAEFLFERAIARDPTLAVAHAELSSVRTLRAAHSGDPALASAAQSSVASALAFDPNLPEAFKALALIHHKNGRPTAAAAAYERAIELRPGYDEATDGLAIMRMAQGRLHESLRLRRQLLTSRLPPTRTHSILGWSLLALGRNEEASRHFFKVLELEPYQLLATEGLVRIDLRKGDLGMALTRIESALRVHPKAVGSLSTKAEILQLQGDFKETARLLRHILTLPGGRNGDTYLRLADVDQVVGSREESTRVLGILEKRFLSNRRGGMDSAGLLVSLAAVYALSNRIDSALETLDLAYRSGYSDVHDIKYEPVFRQLNSDRRFSDLIALHARTLSAEDGADEID